MVYYHIVKNWNPNVSGISHWPVGSSVSCLSPVKLITFPIEHFVDSVTLLIVETFHQAVTALSVLTEDSSTSEFLVGQQITFRSVSLFFLKKYYFEIALNILIYSIIAVLWQYMNQLLAECFHSKVLIWNMKLITAKCYILFSSRYFFNLHKIMCFSRSKPIFRLFTGDQAWQKLVCSFLFQDAFFND